MSDPVIAADGHTYERSAIERWLRQGKLVSPLTNFPLKSKDLYTNYALRARITEAAEATMADSPFTHAPHTMS